MSAQARILHTPAKVPVSDGKYEVTLYNGGHATVLRHGQPWGAYSGQGLGNLEVALAWDLLEAREELAALKASPTRADIATERPVAPPHGCPACDDAMECGCEPLLPFEGASPSAGGVP